MVLGTVAVGVVDRVHDTGQPRLVPSRHGCRLDGGGMPFVYSDGTPRTHHVTSHLAIEVDEQAGMAVSRSCVTVLQALPELPLQPIAGSRYHDRFERRNGRWCFLERRVRINLVGDVMSHHLRPPHCRPTSAGLPGGRATVAQRRLA